MNIKDILKLESQEAPLVDIPGTSETEDCELAQYNKWIGYKERFQNPSNNERIILKSFKECRNFVDKKIAVTRRVHVPPYPFRGQIGFQLEEVAINLFSNDVRLQFLESKKDNPVFLVLLYLEDIKHEWVIVLNEDCLRVLKK